MVKNSSFNDLLSKYNIAIQKSRDLMGQLKDRTDELSRLSGASKHTEKLTRELCEKILAKNRSEMKLGKEYAWSKLSIDELVEKTKKSFDAYTIQVVDSYTQIADLNADLQAKVDNLEDQLAKTLEGSVTYHSQEELEKAVERDKKIEESKSKMKAATKVAFDNGSLDLIDDDTELSDTEKGLYKDLAILNQSVTPTPKSKGKISEQRAKTIKELDKKTHQVSLEKITSDMNEIQKNIILLIGHEGLSKYKDIESKLVLNNIKQTTIRMNMKALVQAQILVLESVSTPNAKISVYYLNALGKRVFEYIFPDTKLIKSEAENIIAEHDNLTHGYGITYVAKDLQGKSNIKKVIDHNRNNPIPVGGEFYIPDIICELDNNIKMYFEYEMGTHSTADFNSKLTKMMKVTKVLNIVFPNKKIMEEVQKKVVRWIDRMGADNLSGIVIRLATVSTIKEMDAPRKNAEWDVIYKPSEGGSNPIIRKE